MGKDIMSKSNAVANLGPKKVEYLLVADKIYAEVNSVVRRVQYWCDQSTGRVHVVAMSYTTPHEATIEDFPFSKWNSGQSFSTIEEAEASLAPFGMSLKNAQQVLLEEMRINLDSNRHKYSSGC